MAPHDDPSILSTSSLVRAVRIPEWITVEDGVERLTSACFLDGINYETSCFVLDDVGGLHGFSMEILPVLVAKLSSKLRCATISVDVVRAKGLWLYRKPEEFDGNSAHVVICGPPSMSKSQYKKKTRELAAEATLHP